jgi:peptidoglycan/xylan/chitin deacetylase (PgdA/CDA1 family)
MPSSRRAAVAATTGVLVLGLAGIGVAVATNRSDWADPIAASSSSSTPTATTTTPSPTTSPQPTTTAPASTTAAGLPSGLAGQDVEVIPTSERVVALTFDAGANADGLASILSCLADEDVQGTFFVTGQWAAAHPDGVAAIVAGGHRVGNHSVSHPHLPALSDQALRDEVLGAEETIRAAGADPRPLFRFPFGDRDDRTITAVNDLGYVAVRWTVDTLGWQGTSNGGSAQRVTDRAVGALQPGEIVLMHVGSNPDDGTTFDADALPAMIAAMRAQGYGFVTLDALVAA